ncbi:MAG: 2-dehydropantoate 2-reductase [Thermoplasmatales archaeon]|nr:MAG: 2-dehydropantoate 2-reductase [Thermoplasmatales archaeon]
MNIVVMGAGAIGSLFGGLLSNKNNVMLIGRTSHVNAIRKNGLNIEDKTQLNVMIPAEDSINKGMLSPDLLILTVKSFDTRAAIDQALQIIDDDTIILSLQNGLDNIAKIKKVVDINQIIAGITTHGAFFSKPGFIRHTGKGKTVLGELKGKKTKRIKHIAGLFNEAGIETIVSEDIIKEIWIKAIVNSSINPLTTFFQCKNGYLLKNPILEKIVEKVCKESTSIAKANGLDIFNQHTIKKTKEVIRSTSENHSSMLQSFKRGKKTEIDSINGKFVDIGRVHTIDPSMNEILIYLVKTMSGK